MKFNLIDFVRLDNGLCKQQEKAELADALFIATNGNPCETGCGWFDRGNCQGYKRLLNLAGTGTNKPKNMATGYHIDIPKTNQQLADELKINKRQVSKLRKTGELEIMIKNYNNRLKEDGAT